SGRTSASQAECRRFDPDRPLHHPLMRDRGASARAGRVCKGAIAPMRHGIAETAPERCFTFPA
ncbi:MAG: hypothetical protein JJU21_10090, partial [Salinarimonas sp.]|nr:hypothetical protein [Salinarimonas sp.]